jgi:hypothetical protein
MHGHTVTLIVTCISKVQCTYHSFIRLTILGHYVLNRKPLSCKNRTGLGGCDMLTRTQALEGGANVTCISKVQLTYHSFIRLTILANTLHWCSRNHATHVNIWCLKNSCRYLHTLSGFLLWLFCTKVGEKVPSWSSLSARLVPASHR